MTTRKPRKLRHGARTANQEYERDLEMREVVKAAEELVDRAWHSSRLTRQQLDSFLDNRPHPLDQARVAARAAAREDLRARWAREDVERAIPLKPNLMRMTSADLREFKNEALDARREAYVAEIQKLNAGARRNEARRLKLALEKVERDVNERDVNERARNRTTPYPWENQHEPETASAKTYEPRRSLPAINVGQS